MAKHATGDDVAAGNLQRWFVHTDSVLTGEGKTSEDPPYLIPD
jgi:hypothetical protein